ncbi:MAG: hypothetical protein FGM14_11645 [Flavobacteriales bacterium]|nr:hypothetical protein [Flavobacteriales bacterium]
MTRISFFIFLVSSFTVLALTSCSKKSTWNAALLSGKSLEEYDVMAKIGAFESCPMILIKDLRIDSNVLFFTIEYEGACDKEETFECVGLEQFNDKIYPPVRQVKLQFKPIADTCQEIKHRTLVVNIRELTVEKMRDVETDLQISGWRTKVRYVYVP